MLVPMGSSGDFLGVPIEGHLVRCAVRKQSGSYRTHNRHPEARALAHLRMTTTRALPDPTKKPPQGASSNSHYPVAKGQCASAQTFFLVKYIKIVNRIRKTNTCAPSCLRSSICGSAAHIRNAVTSLAYCATVAGKPSSNVTWPSFSGCGILMAWPGKYLL